MKFKLKIAVWPEAIHPDGYPTDGKAQLLTFDQDQILEMLRVKSKIPDEKQRAWDYVSIQFE